MNLIATAQRRACATTGTEPNAISCWRMARLLYLPLLLIGTIVTTDITHAQTPIWTQRAYGVGKGRAAPACDHRPVAKSQALDVAGNAYVTGCIQDAAGNADMVTYKVDGATGETLWRSAYAGDAAGGRNGGIALAIDSSGNVIVTGFSTDTVGGQNIRAIKYNGTTGVEIWNVAFDGPGHGADAGYAIALDSAGNAFVTGASFDSAVTQNNMRTIKFSAATGAIIWSVALDGTAANSADAGNAIGVDAGGDVVVTGTTQDAVGGANARTVKYSGATGTELWNNFFNGDGGPFSQESVNAVAIDLSGNVFVAGKSTDGSGGINMRTIKYNGVTGAQLWAVGYTGSGSVASDEAAYAMALDTAGNPIITGFSNDASGSENMRTVKYNGANGAQLWTAFHSGLGNQNDAALAVAVDAFGNVVVTGSSAEIPTRGNFRTIKYNGTNGLQLWGVSYFTNSDEAAYAVSIDTSGNVLVTGANDFPAAPAIRTIKYDGASGVAIWNTQQAFVAAATASVSDLPFPRDAMKVDASGDVFVTGTTTDFNGGSNIRTIKFSGITGAEIWNAVYQGSAGFGDTAYALVLDMAGDVIVAGNSTDTVGSINTRTIKYNGATGALLSPMDCQPQW